MTEENHKITSTGVYQEVLLEQLDKRLDDEVAKALRRNDHLWIAFMAYKVTPPFTADTMPIFDNENLINASFGCYICEKPYDPKIALMKCRGMVT